MVLLFGLQNQTPLWTVVPKALDPQEIGITYYYKENKLNYIEHTLPCLHDDDFNKPTMLPFFTVVCFQKDLSLIFSNHSFIGRISKINNRYWLETEHLLNQTKSNPPPETP